MSMQVMFSSSAVFLFMLLLMCRGSGGVVCAGEVKPGSQSNSLELFKKGETKVDGSGTIVVSSFSAHSLIDVNGLMVAFAEADSNCYEYDCDNEIWSKSLKYEKDKLPSEIKPEGGCQQMAQAVALKKAGEGHYTSLFGPNAVVKGNKIYILVSNSTRLKPKLGQGDVVWDLELLVGTLGSSTGDNQGTITWQDPTSLMNTLKTALKDISWEDVYAPGGKGLLMGGSTIVFPVGARKGDSERGVKHGCTVIYSDDDGVNWNFPSEKIIDKDCLSSTLLEQGGKLFMVTASLESRTRNVCVSTDNGKTWKEDTEADSNLLLDFLKLFDADGTSDVIPATISGRNVTLLTQRRFIPSSTASESRDQVHLFVTDNKRITSVGPVSLDKDIRSVCKLLHKEENGGLFALCDKGRRDSQSAVVFSLAEQLERVKSVLQGWEITDERVSRICISATKEAPCSTPMPTSGLVGFLSNTSDGTHWADEYFGVSATVTGGAKVGNGFRLSGPRAFIEWEIGNKYGTALYSFAGRGLTLVATVTIHDIPQSDTPLMTVGLASKAVGLWYDKENHWKGIIGEGEEGNNYWEKGKPYQVVITVMNGAESVYIDGKRLGGLDPNFRPNNDGRAPQTRGVSHELKEEVRLICFGGCPFMYYGYEINAASHFTVKDVFLYNRVLTEDEIGALEAREPDTEEQQEVSSSEKTSTVSKDQKQTTNSTTQHSVTEGGTVQMSTQEVPSIDEGEKKSHSGTVNPQQVTNNISCSHAALFNKNIRSDDGFAYVQVGGMLLLLISMQLFGLLVS